MATKHIDEKSKARLSQMLSSRENASQSRSTLGASLAGVSKQLEKNLVKDRLHSKLSSRPASPPDATRRRSYTTSTMSNSLKPTATVLERKLTQDKLAHLLKPKFDAVESKNGEREVVVSDVLKGTASVLERKMKRDSLKRNLGNRASRKELVEEGILKDGLVNRTGESQQKFADSLQASAFELQKNLNKDKINGMLRRKSINASGSSKEIALSDKDRFDLMQERLEYACGLNALSKLSACGGLNKKQEGFLKDMIVNDDPKMFAAIHKFKETGDVDGMVKSFYQFAK